MVNLPIYRCPRIAQPVKIDGDATKPAWRQTQPVPFGLADGSGQPRQATSVRACWDGEHLFLAFECKDTDIRATFTARDDKVWQEEAVEAFIAPYGDPRHYFEFQCSPGNVVRDIRVTNPNARGDPVAFDGSWDCPGWRTAVRIDGRLNEPGYPSRGWSAEWSIPLAELLEPEAGPVLPGEEWRVGLFRIDRWPGLEHSAWSPNPIRPLFFHRPLFFGRWIFSD